MAERHAAARAARGLAGMDTKPTVPVLSPGAAPGAGAQQSSLFGLRTSVRAWCAEQRVSQSALAMRAGISASHLNQIIRGRSRPSPALAQRIRGLIGGAP
ncbi:MAG TPA: helix-turn-helix transcriptional regulator [bacterium]|nr:helix-turn-helix transcriptional regulator [bacterium]